MGVKKNIEKEKILRKVIEKAVRNGWKTELSSMEKDYPHAFIINMEIPYWIFSHDFARAFWGEKNYPYGQNTKAWQWQLQQIVLEKSPLKYLEKFL